MRIDKMIDFDDGLNFPCEIKEWMLKRQEFFRVVGIRV